jgi:hypothetical protein
MGLDVEEALRTAEVPAPVPTPGDFDPHPDYQTALEAFLLEAAQNSWKAGAAAMLRYVGGLWAPVADPVVVGSTVTSFIAVSGESLNADEEWLLMGRLLLATGTAHRIRAGLRGTFSSTNYITTWRGSTTAGDPAGGTVSDEITFRSAFSTFDEITVRVELSKRTGKRTLGRTELSAANASGDSVIAHAGVLDEGTSDVTRIDIGSTASSRILAGSETQIFRRIA